MENTTHPWRTVLEDAADDEPLFGDTDYRILSNGERFVFLRGSRGGSVQVHFDLAGFVSGRPNLAFEWNAGNEASLLAILNGEQAAADASGDPSGFLPGVHRRAVWLEVCKECLTRHAYEAFCREAGRLGFGEADFAEALRDIIRMQPGGYLILENTLSDAGRSLVTPDLLTVLSTDPEGGDGVRICTDDGGLPVQPAPVPGDPDGGPSFGHLFYLAWLYGSTAGRLPAITGTPEGDGPLGRLYDFLDRESSLRDHRGCVKAIAARMHEKGVRAVALAGDGVTVTRMTGVLLPKGEPGYGRIAANVPCADGGEVGVKWFDGSEDVDFLNVFREVYDRTRDEDDPDCDDWLEEFLYGQELLL